MSLLAMPLIVTNLGCEMIYILQQRLVAQNIPMDKSAKVLNDVVKAMFQPPFVAQLFQPQDVYSMRSTRTIFDKLAHSSIMRLSESSMDKLFDLMTMGVKYQLVCCTGVSQFLQVTLTHLAEIRKLTNRDVHHLIGHLETKMTETYGNLSEGQWELLRQKLFGYFQNRRVKVSLFLQEGIQTAEGRMIIPGPVQPTSTPNVGTVRTFDDEGNVSSETKVVLDAIQTDQNEHFQHPLPLGGNLYDKKRPKVPPPIRSPSFVVRAKSKARIKTETLQPGAMAGESASKSRPEGEGKREMELLATILNVRKPSEKVKLNLLMDDSITADDAGDTTLPLNQPLPKVINKNGGTKNEAYKESLAGLTQDFGAMDTGVVSAGDDDDLLDLLDSVA